MKKEEDILIDDRTKEEFGSPYKTAFYLVLSVIFGSLPGVFAYPAIPEMGDIWRPKIWLHQSNTSYPAVLPQGDICSLRPSVMTDGSLIVVGKSQEGILMHWLGGKTSISENCGSDIDVLVNPRDSAKLFVYWR